MQWASMPQRLEIPAFAGMTLEGDAVMPAQAGIRS